MKKLVWLVSIASLLSVHHAAAEDVLVKYRGSVPLDSFACEDITRSSFVERVCYDEADQYMIVRLEGAYYHYCEIDPQTVSSFLAAPSMGKYFNARIKGSGSEGLFDCRTHQVPEY